MRVVSISDPGSRHVFRAHSTVIGGVGDGVCFPLHATGDHCARKVGLHHNRGSISRRLVLGDPASRANLPSIARGHGRLTGPRNRSTMCTVDS